MEFVKNVLLAVVVVGGLGLVLGLMIAICSHFLSVEEDPRTDQVIELLPGANCGSCGYPGCAAFAEALIKGEVTPDSCKPCQTNNRQLIKEILTEK